MPISGSNRTGYFRLIFPVTASGSRPRSANLWLLGPRMNFTFSHSVFLTASVQYNSQINKVNINTRLQWRFQPVSDLFLVDTDNYFPDTFQVKNRAVVLKFTYWLDRYGRLNALHQLDLLLRQVV